MSTPAHPLVSIVVIGRNEGERLVRCLRSIDAVAPGPYRIETIYVDSASTDGSPARAAGSGARVVEIRPLRPSAAVGRNAGWRAARGDYVLFLDGDTILHPDFIGRALEALRDPVTAVVWGHRRELAPTQSLYVRVLDLDWIYPPGPSEFCGGDAMMRRRVLKQAGGFDEALIAGEVPDLCRRIREQGHHILHIDAPMTLHDLAIDSFRAYWKRAFRAGYAYADVAHRFQETDDPMWSREAQRNLVHGGLLLTAPLAMAAAMTSVWLALLILLAGGALVLRTSQRCAWKTSNRTSRLLYAMHSHFQQIPIFFGQLAWHRDASRGLSRGLIDYKRS